VIYGWTALALSSSRLALRASTNVMEVRKDGRGSSKATVRQTFFSSACGFRFPHSSAREARHVEQSTKHRTSHLQSAAIHKTALWTIQSFRAILLGRPLGSFNFPDALNVVHLVCDKECNETLEL
jgi:hypothetical protein